MHPRIQSLLNSKELVEDDDFLDIKRRGCPVEHIRCTGHTLRRRCADMPEIRATLQYLQDLPLYETEKPYWCLLPPHEGFDPNAQRVDNLEFESRPDILISDIRESAEALNLDTCGFEVLAHRSDLSNIETAEDVDAYKAETEALLRDKLGAVFVKCYEVRMRKNTRFERDEYDMNDPLLVEGPATGAHNGNTCLPCGGRLKSFCSDACFFLAVF